MTDFFRRLVCSMAILVTLLPVTAFAGVTIHYEGQAKNSAAVETIMNLVREEAKRNGWQVLEASNPDAFLKRVVDEKDVPYQGPVKGVVVRPNSTCEPIYIQIDSNLFMQDFVKTQFAGPDLHIQVVKLFHKIEPYFRTFTVVDEGEYWDTKDTAKLKGHIDKVNSLISEMKRTKPHLKGPVTLPSGRIVDIMSEK